MSATITKASAHRIWMAHREIEEGEKLLADISNTIKEGNMTPLDRYSRGYQLGVPSHGGHRLLDVSPRLAACIIEAHIADKQRELLEASLVAKIEMEAGAYP